MQNNSITTTTVEFSIGGTRVQREVPVSPVAALSRLLAEKTTGRVPVVFTARNGFARSVRPEVETAPLEAFSASQIAEARAASATARAKKEAHVASLRAARIAAQPRKGATGGGGGKGKSKKVR